MAIGETEDDKRRNREVVKEMSGSTPPRTRRSIAEAADSLEYLRDVPPQERTRLALKALFKTVFGALLFVGGIGGTVGTYLVATDPESGGGGVYFIFYGAVFVGIFQSIQGWSEWRRLSK